MVFLYLVICFCLSTPGISCLSLYLTLTNVPSFSQFQIPALIAIHVYVVIYLCDSIWSVSESVHVCFYLFLYMYWRWWSSYQERRVGITLTVLSRPNVCDCPKPGPGFPMSYVVDCLVLSEFNWLERSCLSSFCWYWWNWCPFYCLNLLYTILLFISKCLLTTLTVPHDLLTLALLEMLADLLLSGLIFVSAYPSRTFKVYPWY
jgi:hypothetical protein